MFVWAGPFIVPETSILWEPMREPRRGTAGLGPKKAGNFSLNLMLFFFFFFLVFAFLFSTNTDRQTDKPKSRFQESTEAQAELL